MKNTVYYTLVLLTATLMLSLFPTDAEAKIYEDTVRLHILANSDFPALQRPAKDIILPIFHII